MTSSAYTDILKAVQTVINNLELPEVTVKRRRFPLVAKGDDLPLIIVSPERETVEDEDSEATILIRYPVIVRIVFPGNQLLERDVDRLLDYREAVRKALHTTSLSGASTVIDCDVELNPAYDLQSWSREYDSAIIRFNFLSQESRV